MTIKYKTTQNLTVNEFINILERSILGERRPINMECKKMGIGRRLIEDVQKNLEKNCNIILLSAPGATRYYPKVGFTQHLSAWVLAK